MCRIRVVLFLILTLMAARRRKLGIALDRETLRPVFYSQCFVTAPVTMLIGAVTAIGKTGGETATLVAQILFLGGLVWYLAQQTLWFRAKLGIGLAAAAANAVGYVGQGIGGAEVVAVGGNPLAKPGAGHIQALALGAQEDFAGAEGAGAEDHPRGADAEATGSAGRARS